MMTTGLALVFILKGMVQQHRQWMTGSFAVALVFLEGRVIGVVRRPKKKAWRGGARLSSFPVAGC